MYRIYNLDAAGHTAGLPLASECGDDMQALEFARRSLGGVSIELWKGDELIASLPSKERYAP